MNNQIFNDFERTEFSDEIYAVLGRALTIATRFDVSCKELARLPIFKFAIATKSELDDKQFEELLSRIQSRYKNLNRAIQSLGLTGTIEELMTGARKSRNELIHEAALRAGRKYGVYFSANKCELTDNSSTIYCIFIAISALR